MADPPPTTRSPDFHHFLKLALTRSPKKRATAEKLLQVGGAEQGRGWGAWGHGGVFGCVLVGGGWEGDLQSPGAGGVRGGL